MLHQEIRSFPLTFWLRAGEVGNITPIFGVDLGVIAKFKVSLQYAEWTTKSVTNPLLSKYSSAPVFLYNHHVILPEHF